MTISKAYRFASELALLALASCAPEGSSADAGDEQFVPLPADFAGYESWPSYDLGGADGGATDDAGCAHVADVPRVAFLNHAPPPGSTSFPVGTIVVKEVHTGAGPSDWAIFAMAKRGGGFGPGSGCEGWEWYGLADDDAGTHIQWSGLGPTGSDPYASCGPCASCHASATDNDCVLSPQLALSQW